MTRSVKLHFFISKPLPLQPQLVQSIIHSNYTSMHGRENTVANEVGPLLDLLSCGLCGCVMPAMQVRAVGGICLYVRHFQLNLICMHTFVCVRNCITLFPLSVLSCVLSGGFRYTVSVLHYYSRWILVTLGSWRTSRRYAVRLSDIEHSITGTDYIYNHWNIYIYNLSD